MLGTFPVRTFRGFLFTLFLLAWAAAAPAQMTPDQAAELLLTGARRAYNEKNHAFAAARFREFLGKYGGHKDAAAARYGLALALLDGPGRDYQGALEQLQPLAGNKDFAEHASVLYYLGQCQRGLGLKELAQAAARPQEAAGRNNAARQRFEEAAKQFAAAALAYAGRRDAEGSARALCDLAEMQLRTQKVKEARATAESVLHDASLAKSPQRLLAQYYHGFACLQLGDLLAAGRSLNPLTPFDDRRFGTHARYLLARVHHLSDERPEAARHYDGVMTGYAKQKQAAAEALKRPDAFKNDPSEKTACEALVRDPPPEHVARAIFYLGVLQYEDGRFAEALTRFADFAKQFPTSPLLPDVQLRTGFCQVQLKQFGDALRTLPPVAEREPRLADQALFWLAKAQAGAADPNNPPAREQALRTALDTFRRAAERAQQMMDKDPDAKARRGEILLEMADTQQEAKQFKEAAATYTQVINEKLLPRRDEEAMQRQATALHLAGEFAESDKVCLRFQQTYPKSTLLPAVLFRFAENAAFAAQAAAKNPNLPNRAQELTRLHDEAAKRYQVVVEKYPEFGYAALARYGLGMTAFRKGDFEKAKQILEQIPQAERNGELAAVPYVLADCLLRLAPAKADDAIAAGKMEEQLKAAAELLDGFVSAQPAPPQAADALLKLGLCRLRLASLNAQPAERTKGFAEARAAYERLMQQFPRSAELPQAVFERAKCIALAGDRNGAINELQRFHNDPLKTTSVAPMALLRLAQLLREASRAADAVNVLAQCRQQHEPKLANDPERAGWVPLLQYHHGMALKDAGKLAEARGLFEQVSKQAANRPEAAEASLHWGQCLKEEGSAKLDAARKALAAAKKPEENAAAKQAQADALKLVQDAVRHLDAQAEQLKTNPNAADVCARMLYESAWAYRILAEAEIALARERIRVEREQKLQEAAKKVTPSRLAAYPQPSDIPLSSVSLQPSEQRARAQYQALIAAAPDLPLAGDARLELAEMLAERGELDAAVKLLNEALDKEPAPELTDKIRIRLGVCHAERKDAKAAIALFQAVAQNPKSPLAGQAQYRAGECLLQRGDAAEAVKHLIVFRDQQPFQNLPGLTDRALLRLGHAYAHLKQWDQSRQAHEQVVGRFGNSPWANEARYGIGWAWQNLKQLDNAVGAYSQVTTATATETGARAQLQIGLCRLEQKRFAEASAALLIVPYTFDYPELNAVALVEAARAVAELKQRDQAIKLLERVLRDHPESKWAEVARDRLAALKGG